MAREDASHLAILGCGFQARKHLEAITLVRSIERVVAWDPCPGVAEKFSEEESGRCGISIEYQGGSRADIQGADIICTLTPSMEPVLFGKDLLPGAHINAVGACSPQARELDSEAVAMARLFVDRREAALCEAGDFLIPRNEGFFADDHIVGEIGEILVHESEGRRSSREITLFESLGLAVEDLASARYVYQRALEEGAGLSIEL